MVPSYAHVGKKRKGGGGGGRGEACFRGKPCGGPVAGGGVPLGGGGGGGFSKAPNSKKKENLEREGEKKEHARIRRELYFRPRGGSENAPMENNSFGGPKEEGAKQGKGLAPKKSLLCEGLPRGGHVTGGRFHAFCRKRGRWTGRPIVTRGSVRNVRRGEG